MEASKTLLAILILVLVVVAVAGIWTTLTQDSGSKIMRTSVTAQGRLYINVVKPVRGTGNLELTIKK